MAERQGPASIFERLTLAVYRTQLSVVGCRGCGPKSAHAAFIGVTDGLQASSSNRSETSGRPATSYATRGYLPHSHGPRHPGAGEHLAVSILR